MNKVSFFHSKRTRIVLASLLLLIVVVFLRNRSPQSGMDAGFRNLLLITLDTTRADRMGAYGYAHAKTPNFDRLAREGILFEQCMAVAPITLPSHASILTGLYPSRHGARNNGTHQLAARVPTLAEQLQQAGFATGAVVSSLVLDSRWGLDRGFDHYDDDLSQAEPTPLFMFRETRAQDTARRAVHWLRKQAEGRFFLWVHFYDPHADYDAPEPFRRQCPRSPYDAEIAYADAGIGEILESLRTSGELQNTLVVVTADHGESLGEHGETTHSVFVYEATQHVPLVFWHPRLQASQRISQVVSSVDLVPTVLDFLDVQPLPNLDGMSLWPALIRGQELPADRVVYAESMNPYYNHGWAELRSLRGYDYRYIQAPREEFFDLAADPSELRNLSQTPGVDLEPYRSALRNLLPAKERDVWAARIHEMDPSLRQSLAELGYVWTEDESEGNDQEEKPRKDPKDGIVFLEHMAQAHQWIRDKEFARAEQLLKEILDAEPQSVLAQSTLASIYVEQEQWQLARKAYQEILHGSLLRVHPLLRLAEVERRLQEPSWTRHLEAAKNLDPEDPMPWVREGDWAEEDGFSKLAEIAYRTALEKNPDCAKAWIGLGNTLHRQARESEAEDSLLQAVRLDPLAYEAFYNLGVVCEVTNRPQQAEVWYREALRCEPDQVLVLVNLANLYFREGQLQAAEKRYLQALEKHAEDFSLHFNFAIFLNSTNRSDQAETHFESALRIDPERFATVLKEEPRLREIWTEMTTEN